MFLPLPVCIGLRYVRAKRRNQFISFISLISMLGIALGVAVLITVLSVTNGFDSELRTRILSFVPAITISQWNGTLSGAKALEAELQQNPEVLATASFISGEAMLATEAGTAFVQVQGINPGEASKVFPLSEKMIAGQLFALKPHQFGIVVGEGLAGHLGLGLGDKVSVYVPKATLSLAGILPRLKQFTVVGIFKVGYEYDYNIAMVDIEDASALWMFKPGDVTGVQIKLSDLFLAPKQVALLEQKLSPNYRISSWAEQNANFFKALKMEKLMMFLMLSLIIAVAAFNMLSSLVMLVTDKQADIAILRTLGMSSSRIMMIFVIQGLIVALIGILAGVALGVEVAWHVTSWVEQLQRLLGTDFLSADVYYINFLPSLLLWADVLKICALTFLLSFLATLYPAWRAAQVKPAEALRHE